MEIISGIYSITNSNNGKRYVGSSENINRRFMSHKMLLSKGKHHSIHLQRAWDKNGKQAFVFSIIELCDQIELIAKEQQHIDIKADYNIVPKAYDSPTFKGLFHTPETRAKMSAAQSGKKHAMYGRHHTEEAKEKIRRAATGKRHTLESRAKMSKKLKGKQPFLGLKHSDETREKMSKLAKRLWAERLSNGYERKKPSEETKIKIGIANKLVSDRTPPEVRSARAYKAWETKRAKEKLLCQAQ